MADTLASESTQQPGHAVADTPGHKVFAGNLPYSVTDESLRQFFAVVSDDIISAQVITRGTRSAGYGFVTVNTLQAAQKACETLDKYELEGRQVLVEIAKPADQKDKERSERRANRRTGRARGRAPPGEVTEAEASGEADKADQTQTDASAATDGKKKPKKKRFNKKKREATNAEADADQSHTVNREGAADEARDVQKKPKFQKAKRPQRPAGEDPIGEPSKNMLFVANLGFGVDDAGLTSLFTDVGINVVTARIVRKRWGKPRKSKGFGFVDVGDEEQQKKAIAALQGKEVEGRQIAVKVAVNAFKDEEDAGAVDGTGEESPDVVVVAQ